MIDEMMDPMMGPEEEAPWEEEDYAAEVIEELGCDLEEPVLDREGVEKLVKRMSRIEAEMAESVIFLDAEIARLQARRQQIVKPYQSRKSWLQNWLPAMQEYSKMYLAGKKERSLKLTYGDVGFRKTPERVEVPDEESFVQWALQNARLGLVKMTPKKTEIKNHITSTGELPLGVELVPGEDKFYVKPLVGEGGIE